MLIQDIADIARALDEAERERKQIRPISVANPDIAIQDSYAIQSAWIDMKLARGRRILGRKVGVTSRAIRNAFMVKEPDYGTLLDDMLYEDGSDIPADRFITPLLEIEIAFILGKRLAGRSVSIFDALSATEYVVPALEIVDLRVPQIDPETQKHHTIYDTVADNAASAGVLLGGRPMRPPEVDLRWVPAVCYRNGIIEESGVSAAVMNHPAHSVAWLARKLSEFDVSLNPGDVILSGSFTRVVPARAGDIFHVDFHGMGSIACRFT